MRFLQYLHSLPSMHSKIYLRVTCSYDQSHIIELQYDTYSNIYNTPTVV